MDSSGAFQFLVRTCRSPNCQPGICFCPDTIQFESRWGLAGNVFRDKPETSAETRRAKGTRLMAFRIFIMAALVPVGVVRASVRDRTPPSGLTMPNAVGS